ncbi:(Lyso)-N-acylphosphatidylethanolamine lipase-like isoform X1 [Harmonia axyridis]|uniref:(Lyso)-N-acylphosphatidylethanolamine lipase-like isoform X1 n=1 Tax=Harmonia axyridis TaxID=115357 RepID=UPI001E279CAF|nr:(Lyso)-N-acylphosphatidylethanolamine lipase-like isoform X1 [Harmonia axyridis]
MFWNQFSSEKLEELEGIILSTLRTPYTTFHVPVELKSGSEEIWTISLNSESKKTPLVLIHGFAAGIGFWCRNLDELSKDRPVYAIDLLGFGRSSRPTFSYDYNEVEKEMVNSIEVWRKKLNLEKFHLLGHSMGGFIGTAYTLCYPERVCHLLLADPWGFSDHLNEKPSFWSSIIFSLVHVRPLEFVRAIGPLGPWLIQRGRSDIAAKFEDIIEDNSVFPNYVYHCNAQNPTGERAAYSMIWGYGWSKNPMLLRIDKLKKDIPLSLIFGSNTWMDISIGEKIKDLRPDCSVDIKIIDDTGHHLYSEKPDVFNDIVVTACHLHDKTSDVNENEIGENYS